MSARNDGGPAFPCGDPTHGGNEGMTLRDYFAIRASEEDIQRYTSVLERVAVGQSEEGPVYRTERVFRSREEARYKWADAMLKARQA